MPKVSIGLPVYNGAESLGQVIECLINQTFTDFELIISDNASTDDTAAICRKYSELDKRISYVRQTVNIGAVANFNFVLEQASGELFMWAAADDAWDASFISTLVTSMEDNPDAAVSFSNLRVIDADGNPVMDFSFDWLSRESQQQQIQGYLAADPILGACNLMYGLFRRKILLAATQQFFWTEDHFSADFSFILYVLLQGRFIHTPLNLFEKRVGGLSWSMRTNLSIMDKLKKVNSMYRDARMVIRNNNSMSLARKARLEILAWYGFVKFLGFRLLPSMKWNKVRRLSEDLANENRRHSA